MQLFHVTPRSNANKLTKCRELKANQKELSKAGFGVYLFAGAENIVDMVDYLIIDDPIVVTVDVDVETALMDEDALFVDGIDRTIEDLYRIMPPEGVMAYNEWLTENGNDVGAFEDIEVAKFKINLIDKYMIKPHSQFTTNFGHFAIFTLRCPVKSVSIVSLSELP